MSESRDGVRLSWEGAVAVISYERAEKMNAANDAMDTRLFEILRELCKSERVRAVVWRGEGAHFSSGRDTSELGVRSEDVSHFDFIERGHKGARNFLELPVPSIVALKGWVIGGSFERALLCDLRFAGESARMRLPEILHGVVPDSGGSARLFQIAGHGLLADLALTGRVLDAREAWRHGIVSRVTPDAELDETVLQAAQQIATAPPLVVRMFLRSLRRMTNPLTRRTLQEESLAQSLLLASDDFAELRAARAEKRAPRYRGR